MTGRLWIAVFGATLAVASVATAQGFLVPSDPRHPACSITFQRVNVTIREQAAETRVEQEFRNHASVPIEAFYMFPLPAGAAVKDFAMTVDGKRVKGEVVEAGKARQVYEDIVRRTKDPGLLEHMGKNLWRVRVFPVPAQGRQKFEMTYSEVVAKEAGLATYTYPLKAANQEVRIDGFFAVRAELHSSAPLKSVYSPSHQVGVTRESDRKAIVGFEENNAVLNRDFQLYWTTDDRDVGLSLLTHRESAGEPGYFLMLVSPKVEIAASARVPRDVVFVLDTSGSMREDKMAQARKALEFCLKSLDKQDRFGLISFATTVNPFERSLKSATPEVVQSAVEWVRKLEAGGGTAIADALADAIKMRTSDARNFTVVFLTDGQPTIGETDPTAILKSVAATKTEQTRIFTFGVGDDVNTHLLDQIADETRAASSYVRPKEDLEVKVSAFFDKIRHPVLANLSVEVDGDKRLSEMYPPKLPDLFHGGQLVVAGRFTGKGDCNIRLKGKIGDSEKEFVYKVSLPEEKREQDFLPSLWARRKVGYLLDEIRLRGENRELREEVVFLAKKFGIATPYTSYLVVPDQPPRGPIAGMQPGFRENLGGRSGRGRRLDESASRGGAEIDNIDLNMGGGPIPLPAPSGGVGGGGGFGGGAGNMPGAVPKGNSFGTGGDRRVAAKKAGKPGADPEAKESKEAFGDKTLSTDSAVQWYVANEVKSKGDAKRDGGRSQQQFGGQSGAESQGLRGQEAGTRAVDLAVELNKLKESATGAANSKRLKSGSEFMAVGGVWVDRALKPNAKVVKVKYLSPAYFDVIAKLKGAKEALALGPQVVWVTPGGAVLQVDVNDGAEKLRETDLALLLAPAPAPTPAKKS